MESKVFAIGRNNTSRLSMVCWQQAEKRAYSARREPQVSVAKHLVRSNKLNRP
jgi:hypothetical protein